MKRSIWGTGMTSVRGSKIHVTAHLTRSLWNVCQRFRVLQAALNIFYNLAYCNAKKQSCNSCPECLQS